MTLTSLLTMDNVHALEAFAGVAVIASFTRSSHDVCLSKIAK
jgi:hypothetical protein